MSPPSLRKTRRRGKQREGVAEEMETMGRRALPVVGAPYKPRHGEKSCFEEMPLDANDYLKRVIHQRSLGPQATSIVLSSEQEEDEDDDDGGGSISSFASFDCIETPIVHANYRSGVRDSEEVEVWLREFRELRERLEGFPDDQEQVIFSVPITTAHRACSDSCGSVSPRRWSTADFVEMGLPTEDVVAEIDSSAAVVALETVAEGISMTAGQRSSHSRRRRGCGESELTFVQWCIWCYALMLRIQHPLTASTASDMQSILASLQRYVLCPQPLPSEDPPEATEWAVRHGRLVASVIHGEFNQYSGVGDSSACI